MVHIVGTASTIAQKDGMMLHHTLGNGNFHVFADMSREISCVTAKLNDPYDAATQIDHALQQCWIKAQPVYLSLPTDMVQKKVEGKRLETPIDLSLPPNKKEQEDYVVDVVLKYLHDAKNPVILVDACTIRHRVMKEVEELANKTGLPVFVTPMGKSGFNEQHENYGGVYAGAGSEPGVADRVESSDLILRVGSIASDFNTGKPIPLVLELIDQATNTGDKKPASPTRPPSSTSSISTRLVSQCDIRNTPRCTWAES